MNRVALAAFFACMVVADARTPISSSSESSRAWTIRSSDAVGARTYPR